MALMALVSLVSRGGAGRRTGVTFMLQRRVHVSLNQYTPMGYSQRTGSRDRSEDPVDAGEGHRVVGDLEEPRCQALALPRL